jgi:hypothetical protein
VPRTHPSLLVDEELARAVRTESAAALTYWWGASGSVVHRWRRATGVTRTNNPGSNRLIRAASAQGAEAAAEREWTDAERAHHRRLTAERGLARHLTTGYHGPRWTPEELALLGRLPDEEVARRIGRTPDAVRQRRERLGIPKPLTDP